MSHEQITPGGKQVGGEKRNTLSNALETKEPSHLQRNGPALMALGYDVVPIAPGSKGPKISGWQKIKATSGDIPGWLSSHTGCGIRGPRTVGVDIDCYDQNVTQHMLNFTRTLLGKSPFRVGMMPKALLPYRCETPFKKMTSARFRSPDGNENRLEILADGQQFVASHIHPHTGKSYTWHYPDGTQSETLTWHRHDLPEITEAAVRAIVLEFEEQCRQRGWYQFEGNRLRDEIRPQESALVSVPHLSCPEDQRAVVNDALLSMPSEDRDLWQRMGHACKAEGATGWARDLWFNWSATSNKHKEKDQETWESFKPERTDYRSILAEAQRRGWINPASRNADIQRLAALSAFEYEQIRESESKRLKVRVSAMDKAVAAARNEADTKNVSSCMFPAIELWPEAVDGAPLLEEIADTVKRFIVCEPETATAVALWIALTWFIDRVQVAPLAVITAPEKRCGKSQLLDLIGRLSRRPLVASNISPAAIFRVIEAHGPTLLIDEADSFLKENEEARGVLNSGHTRQSAFVVRVVGEDHTPTRFNTFGAKAISGIGSLADTLMDRGIILELRRKLPHEAAERLRHADGSHFQRLASMLARYAQDAGEAVENARPALPDILNDRAQDNWEPLLAIADHAGRNWPLLAREVALKISGKEQEAVSISVDLLADIRDIFETQNVDKITTATLLAGLCSDDTKPWAGWNRGKAISASQLAKRLKDYKIQPKNVRIGTEVYKGYDRIQFEDVFIRYLSRAATPLQNP